MAEKYDVCVIGSGPGGYVAAIRAAQLGHKTAIIERDAVGGVCLNVGCIPSKAMITAAHFLHKMNHDASTMGLEISGSVKVNMPKLVQWKQSVCNKMSSGVQQLLKANKLTVIMGEAHFQSPKELSIVLNGGKEKKTVVAKNFIVATGSRPIEIPGFTMDEKDVLSSTGALALDEVPPKICVIGGGYIGLEIGSYLSNLGSDVSIVEASPSLLNGVIEPECVQVVSRRLKKNGVSVLLNAQAKSMEKKGKVLEVTVSVSGKTEKLKVDKVLLTVGRKPNSDQLNLKEIGVQLDDHGFISTDAQRRTNHPNIYAIGDIAGQPMLAHKASYEGVMVAEVISGKNRAYDVKTVPAVIFTDPEIATVGWTENECKDRGYKDLKVGKFPFAANGRAVSMLETDGFVKIVADAQSHVVLGVQIVGPDASHLISEGALAIEMGATLEDLALTIHPHPTLGEALMETAEAALGHAIHIIQRPLRAARASKSEGIGKT